jgi:hypothetical protein
MPLSPEGLQNRIDSVPFFQVYENVLTCDVHLSTHILPVLFFEPRVLPHFQLLGRI